MRSSRGACLGKKTLGYRERAPHRCRAYLRLRERYVRRGKVLVYVDESGFAPTVTRRYAYAPKGHRVYGLCAGERRPRTSLLAARNGATFSAPLLFTGSCNTPLFAAWLAQQLCPRLTAAHVVILDNAAFHKSAATQTLIPQTGATLLFLPPMRPTLTPSNLTSPPSSSAGNTTNTPRSITSSQRTSVPGLSYNCYCMQ
jgi:putative transposase